MTQYEAYDCTSKKELKVKKEISRGTEHFIDN